MHKPAGSREGSLSPRELLVWGGSALVALLCILTAFPRAFPFYPQNFSVSRGEAIALALERLAMVAPLPKNPYIVAELATAALVEERLLETRKEVPIRRLQESAPAGRALEWRVTVYGPAVRSGNWALRATISPDGRLNSLQKGVRPDEKAPPLDPALARPQADALLSRHGVDLSRYEEPTVRRTERQNRTDTSLFYRERAAVLGPGLPYGLEVTFAGDGLTGFRPYLEDPGRAELETRLQPSVLLGTMRFLVIYLLVPFVGVVFLRRYHAGEIGVRRALHIFAAVFGSGSWMIAMSARGATEDFSFGVLSRQQSTWAWGFQLTILWFSALALLAALSWAAGEASCRERWGRKLASFDALFQRKWNNTTVARSAFLGLTSAVVLASILLLLVLLLERFGALGVFALVLGPWWHSSAWPGLNLVLFTFSTSAYVGLFAWLFVLPAAIKRLGTWGGSTAVVAMSCLLFWPPLATLPASASLLLSAIKAAVLIALFLKFDLLTALIASVASECLLEGVPLLLADDPFLKAQGLLPLVIAALPLALSFRSLLGGEEFVYRYEDVPPHVRRIAERERQRVELETARQIQTSILPDLPPQLAGVALAHAYLPASEVGGDFYDVLALENGNLAVAVGDVAGHGVSSGLVMSMAKSALAMQVTFNPDVRAVFHSLNRMVHQTARMRLLTTLCYAVLDPKARELAWASAGHLSPYRVDARGNVEELPSTAYPLGVRDRLEIDVRRVALNAGDRLFLFSDGIVEARREGSDDVFGFERLKASLRNHAHRDVEGLRDGVLADVADFVHGAPREDDQTILVLGLPT